MLHAPSSPEEAAQALVDIALSGGTRDNVTAVVCDVEVAPDVVEQHLPAFHGAAAARFSEELETT